MPVIPVRDLSDPRLDRFRNVRDADLLSSHGVFVAEGRRVVERVLLDGKHPVEQCLLAPAAWDALASLIVARAPHADVFLLDSTSHFAAVTGFNLHRGCLALARRPAPLTWRDGLGDGPLSVVLEAVTDADNVGAVFRNAAAFGAGGVLLSPTCCDPLYRKAIRTSMGASTRVPFARLAPWPESLHLLAAHGVSLVALSPRTPSLTLDEYVARDRPPRIALLVGTEGEGLSPEAEAAADVRVRIPVRAAVDSLNLAVAAGIALSRLASTAPDLI
jgi:tRNA G18 (ribose-2'-O)-methylase SpoU